MADHASALRLYYLALTSGVIGKRTRVELHWSRELTEEWLRTLRLPPFQNVYRIKPRGEVCDCARPGGPKLPNIRTEANFPGGTRLRCDDCGAKWLVMTP